MAPPTNDSDDDRKAKDLVVDPATAAELRNWFGLPSYQELEDKGTPATEDPGFLAVREQRAKAIAAVDPGLLESIRKRAEPPDDLIRFKTTIDVRIDPTVASFDHGMLDRLRTTVEPRELDLPNAISDDLKICTPQAILRDLHRVETRFAKQFEIVDVAAELRIEGSAAAAMATNWKLPLLEAMPMHTAGALWEEVRAERQKPWPDLLTAHPLPNRRVQES